jgi:hypothetical protein
MLHQITWQQYLLFVAVVLLLYYAIILLAYYRRPGPDLSGRDNIRSVPEKEDEGLFQGEDEQEDEILLGKVAEEYGVSTLSSEDIHFGPKRNEEQEHNLVSDLDKRIDQAFEEVNHPDSSEQSADDDELIRGAIADLLQECKPVYSFVSRHDKTLSTFLMFFERILDRYPQVTNSKFLDTVFLYVADQSNDYLPFEISHDVLREHFDQKAEMEQLWELTRKENSII